MIPIFSRHFATSARLIPAAVSLLFLVRGAAAQADSLETSPTTSYAYLGKQLDQKIAELDWGDKASVGFLAMDLESGLPVLDLNADQPLPPGSPIKLYTALAALDLLGPDFRFATSFACKGRILKRRLKGDWFKTRLLEGTITVVGSGDPTLSSTLAGSPEAVNAALDRWIDPMRNLKVKAFTGDIVVDASLFDAVAWPPGWPEELAAQPAYPEVSALNFNDNCVDILWDTRKSDVGKIAPHTLFPALPRFVFFSNNVRVQLTASPAREYQRDASSNVLKAAGKIPPGVVLRERAATGRPAQFFGEALAQRMREREILVLGGVHEGKAAAGDSATTPALASGEIPFQFQETIQSPPLEQIVAAMLRDDRALDAEVLLKTLGLHKGRGAGFGQGVEVVLRRLRDGRIPTSGLALLDGSGNSTLDRASARHLMSVMDAIRRGPHSGRILDAMARNGRPGQLESRFKIGVDAEAQNPVEVHAISGNPVGGASLAGWTLTRAGRPIHFVFIVSGSNLTAAELQQRMDAVISEITRSFIR